MLVTISEYEIWGDALGDFLSNKFGERVAHISIFKRPKGTFRNKSQIIRNLIVSFVKIVIKMRLLHNKKVYCDGAQLAAIAIYRTFGLFLGNSHLYVYNFYIHSWGKLSGVKIVLKLLLNSHRITLMVQTPSEIQYYRSLSDIIRIEFVPFCSDFMPIRGNSLFNGKFYFTGGYTNRDYALINELANNNPDDKFVVIASELNNLPVMAHNITLFKDASHEDFEATLAASQGVIIPLLDDVGSSGQMLAISAMRNRKPIIYSNVSSINYYFPQNCGYPYEIGNLNSLQNAFVTMKNDSMRNLVGENAYRESLRYTIQSRCEMQAKILGYE